MAFGWIVVAGEYTPMLAVLNDLTRSLSGTSLSHVKYDLRPLHCCMSYAD